MATNAKTGMGTKFSLARPTDPNNFILISERTRVTPPKLSKGTAEATHMDSEDDYQEYIATLKDGGEVGVEVNLVPGSSSDLLMAEALASPDAWPTKIEYKNGTTWDALGIVTNYEPGDLTPDGKMSASLTSKVTGKPTLTTP